MSKTSSGQIHSVLTDPCASHWLKHCLETAVQRDPVDVLHDLSTMLQIFTLRSIEAASTAGLRRSAAELRDLQREWYRGAEAGGILGMIGTVCRQLGATVPNTYGPKYKLDLPGAIQVYVDDYGHYMTVYAGTQKVCSTHECDRLFVPGEWVQAVTSRYPDAVTQEGRKAAEREAREVEELAAKLLVEA